MNTCRHISVLQLEPSFPIYILNIINITDHIGSDLIKLIVIAILIVHVTVNQLLMQRLIDRPGAIHLLPNKPTIGRVQYLALVGAELYRTGNVRAISVDAALRLVWRG